MQDERRTVIELIVGGFFIALPAFLAGLVLAKMYTSLQHVVHGLLDVLPGALFRDPTIRCLAVIVVIAALLLLVGWLAQTRIGRALGRRLETVVFNRLPLYTLLRNLASGLAGKDSTSALKPVLVTVNPGIRQMGLLVERHADGSGTVFLPSSPNPGSGTVLVVEASLIRELHVPSHRMLTPLSHWGDGMAKVLESSGEGKGDGARLTNS